MTTELLSVRLEIVKAEIEALVASPEDIKGKEEQLAILYQKRASIADAIDNSLKTRLENVRRKSNA
jgi:hypothetical protein